MNDAMLWMAEPHFLESALADVAAAASGASPMMRANSQGPAHINIVGLLLPTVPDAYREYGISATGYDEIIDQVRAAMASPEQDIYMAVDSGGGSVKGIDAAITALKQLAETKRVVAFVDGMAASAAYWLASTATEINATRMSEIGGIGAFYALPKGSNNVVVVRSSPHKGAGVDGWTEEQLAAMQSMVDKLGTWFLNDVNEKRGTTDPTIGSGRVWLAEDAMAMKLINGVTQPGGMAAEQAEKRRLRMSEELTQKLAEANAKLEALQAREAARADMLAAFPDDPAFAVAQFNAGASVVDALKTKLKQAMNAAAAMAAAPAIPNGSTPEPKPVAPVAKNWNEAIAEYAHAHNCDILAAARAVDRANPELRIAHLEAVVSKGGK